MRFFLKSSFQISYPTVSLFLWNGVNYLEKMMNDNHFMTNYPIVLEWLGFDPEISPLIVPLEVYEDVRPLNSIILSIYYLTNPIID